MKFKAVQSFFVDLDTEPSAEPSAVNWLYGTGSSGGAGRDHVAPDGGSDPDPPIGSWRRQTRPTLATLPPGVGGALPGNFYLRQPWTVALSVES